MQHDTNFLYTYIHLNPQQRAGIPTSLPYNYQEKMNMTIKIALITKMPLWPNLLLKAATIIIIVG